MSCDTMRCELKWEGEGRGGEALLNAWRGAAWRAGGTGWTGAEIDVGGMGGLVPGVGCVGSIY